MVHICRTHGVCPPIRTKLRDKEVDLIHRVRYAKHIPAERDSDEESETEPQTVALDAKANDVAEQIGVRRCFSCVLM